MEIWVVDSASTDGSADMVREAFPRVGLITNSENVGFTSGNNLGMARCRGRAVLLLNPDTEIVGDALTVMADYLDTHPDVGIVGPRILTPDGGLQPSRRRFPTYGTAFVESTCLQRWFPRHPLLARYYMWDVPDDREQDVDWLEGACLMARAEVVRQIGGLDERFFMYSEEMDWCLRAKRAGWHVVYLPQAAIIHYGGKSSEWPSSTFSFSGARLRTSPSISAHSAANCCGCFSWARMPGCGRKRGPSGWWATAAPCEPSASPRMGKC